MRKLRKPFSKMEGLTLLETMFAIAVGALVLIGAIIFYMSTKQSANANKAVGDLNAIVAAYQTYIATGQTVTTGKPLITDLQKLNYLPDPLYNPWGQIYTDAANGGAVTASGTTTTIAISILGINGTGDNNCKAIANLAGATASGTTNATIQDESTTANCIIQYTL